MVSGTTSAGGSNPSGRVKTSETRISNPCHFFIWGVIMTEFNELLDKKLSLVYCNTMNYDTITDTIDIFETIVIKVGSKYLSIGCEERSLELNKLIIKDQDTPDPLEYGINEYNNLYFTKPISTINIWSVIKSIKLLFAEKELTGLILNLENKKKLAITATYPNGPRLTFNENRIAEIEKESTSVVKI